MLDPAKFGADGHSPGPKGEGGRDSAAPVLSKEQGIHARCANLIGDYRAILKRSVVSLFFVRGDSVSIGHCHQSGPARLHPESFQIPLSQSRTIPSRDRQQHRVL